MTEVGVTEVELPLESVGARLLRAREASGMSRAELAGMTRIPERHLAAIEANDFAALPARTYAVGFSRSYAKALGIDEAEIVAAVRDELSEQEPADPRRTVQNFEPGDPARVPGARLTWLAAVGVVAVIAAGFYLVRPMFTPGMSLPSILPAETPGPVASAPVAAPAPAPVSGPVMFTALQPRVWVKFSDGAGNQLLQKELAQGESWTVPADVPGVTIWTARPDALAITIAGQAVPKLSDVQTTLKDVPVSAAALLARGTAAPVPAPQAGAMAAPQAQRQAAPVRQRRVASTRAPTPQQSAPPVAAPSIAVPTAAPAPAPVPAAT